MSAFPLRGSRNEVLQTADGQPVFKRRLYWRVIPGQLPGVHRVQVLGRALVFPSEKVRIDVPARLLYPARVYFLDRPSEVELSTLYASEEAARKAVEKHYAVLTRNLQLRRNRQLARFALEKRRWRQKRSKSAA